MKKVLVADITRVSLARESKMQRRKSDEDKLESRTNVRKSLMQFI